MRNFFLIVLHFIIVNFYNASEANIKNKIVLKVENEIITNYEIKNKILITLVLAGDEINQQNINKLKKQALETLIQTKLKKIELKKYKLEKDINQINNYLNLISSNDIPSLQNKFKINNLDFNLFLDEIETQFKWQEFIYNVYSKKIQLDESIIDKSLEKIIKNQSNIVEFNLSEIELARNDLLSDDKAISNIVTQIKIEGFETTAIKYSTSPTASNKGNLGWINARSLSKKIFEIVNQMKVGEISSPIKRQNNLLFLKLNNKRISKTENINVSKLRKNLINQKRSELFNLHSRSHLSKLRNTVLIEYNEK